MNALLLMLLLGGPTYEVTGTVTSYKPWCGGRAGQGTVQPGSGERVQFYSPNADTTGEPAATAVSAHDGTFKVALPPGEYCVIAHARGARPSPADVGVPPVPRDDRYKNDPPDFAYKCALGEWQRCDASFVVKDKAVKDVAIALYGRCGWQPGPCYRGPPIAPPPSARH
jgi:hypothetical protein